MDNKNKTLDNLESLYTKKGFIKVIKQYNHEEFTIFFMIILFGLLVNYKIRSEIRYVIFVFHHLGWISLKRKPSINYTSNDLLLIFIKKHANTVFTEEEVFEMIGISRNTFKKNYPKTLNSEGKITLLKLVKFLNKWTDNDWRRVKAIPKGTIDKLEGFYPRKTSKTSNSIPINEALKGFGYNRDSLPRKIPPVIVQMIFNRGIDPDFMTFEMFIDDLEENYL